MRIVSLTEADPRELAPKAAALARLAAAGLRVPHGVVVALGPRGSGAWRADANTSAMSQLTASGPVIVRSALALEDTDATSGAGLGLSIPDCTDPAEVLAALARVDAQRSEPWLVEGATDDGAGDQAIVQRQVPRQWLVAVADHPDGIDAQVHDAGNDALGAGATPSWAGALERWPDPAAPRVAEVVRRIRGALPSARHGREIELVVDPHGEVHVVQARPFVMPVHPGAAQLLDEARARDPALDLRGRLVLDAEHNPAPLSAAHAWLMHELRRRRPDAGDPTVLAGWLYVRVLPRALSGSPASEGPSAREVLGRLRDELLPRARARLAEVQANIVADDPHAIARAFEPAMDAFFAMIDLYIGVLVPARARARARGHVPVADPDAPLSLEGRAEFLDILPAAWDLASPTLAELEVTASAAPPAVPLDEPRAATLLGEWDDHLFALGLAPLRRVILRAGASLAIGDDAFLLTPPELVQALVHGDPELAGRIEARRLEARASTELRPPLCLEDGRPVAIAALGSLRGLGIGPSVDGVIAPRRDLADLLAHAPSTDAIVTLPALTAQAAIALHRSGVRAVCCEHGGPLSHATLMARELRLSALIGCRGCTQVPAGTRARVDTTTGRLRVGTRLRPTRS